MKIVILTLHRVTNFGSLLQTYATELILKKMGHEVEVIDFVPEGLTFKRAIWPKNGNVLKKLIKLIPLMICNVYQFHMSDKFLKKNITLTKKRYKNYNELERLNLDGDIYLSGSDQVWNTQNGNSEEDLGAYYLSFAEGKPKIAYAGSFGRTDFSVDEKVEMKKRLEKYNSISVREADGVRIINSLGIICTHVVDPTFLASRKEWTNFYFANKKSLPKKGYIFVYNLNRNKLIETIAKNAAKKYGLKIINFADTFEYIIGAKNKMFNDPYDFIGYLANAEYVITDSFHGTSFSINMEKQFVTVAAPKYNCRIESVLNMMHCEDRLADDLEDALRILDNRIDYSVITPIVEEQRSRSKEFLEKAIDECKCYR